MGALKKKMLTPNKALFIWTVALIVVVGVLPFTKLWVLIFLAVFALIFLCLWLVRDSATTKSIEYEVPDSELYFETIEPLL